MTNCPFTKRCILAWIFELACFCGAVWYGKVPQSVNQQSVHQLIKDSCVHCHDKDGETPLDLTAIVFDLENEATLKTWERVYDRLSAEEVPPDNKPKPDPRRLAAAMNRLQGDLHQTSLQTQRREGRVPARRLTKLEYRNTICDLVRIRDDVAADLPGESDSGRFDTIGHTQ